MNVASRSVLEQLFRSGPQMRSFSMYSRSFLAYAVSCSQYRCSWLLWWPRPVTNLPGSIPVISIYRSNSNSRYSGAYSVLGSMRTPKGARDSLISSSRTVIFLNSLYRLFSVPFFHTKLYLFAFASSFVPSMYRCCRSTCSFLKIHRLIARKISSMLFCNSSRMKYPNAP